MSGLCSVLWWPAVFATYELILGDILRHCMQQWREEEELKVEEVKKEEEKEVECYRALAVCGAGQ